MIVEERTGDLFSYDGPVIGHGVNTEGVMGAGIAAVFRMRWPGMYADYRLQCAQGELQPGCFFGWQYDNDTKMILNLATQDKPGRHAQLSWVRSSVMQASYVVPQIFPGCQEFAIPRIGCGIGGLQWYQVKGTLAFCTPDDFRLVVYSREEDQ